MKYTKMFGMNMRLNINAAILSKNAERIKSSYTPIIGKSAFQLQHDDSRGASPRT